MNYGEDMLRLMEKKAQSINGDRWQKLERQADLLKDFGSARFPYTFLLFVSGVAAGMASWNFLNMLVDGSAIKQQETSQDKSHDLVLQVTRGMPHNPTTEMDLMLWNMAKTIRDDQESFQLFQDLSSETLTKRYQTGELPFPIMLKVDEFINRYGGRGLGEIDLGRKRWAEDPRYVFETLANFLNIKNEDKAPDVIFSGGSRSAQQAIDKLALKVRKKKNGWIKSRLVRFFAGRARQLMGLRESPKFFAVRIFWLIWKELLITGREFAESGEIQEADDLFYLTFSELKNLQRMKPII